MDGNYSVCKNYGDGDTFVKTSDKVKVPTSSRNSENSVHLVDTFIGKSFGRYKLNLK